MHDNGDSPQNNGYQLLIRAKLIGLGEGLAGCCNIRLEGPDDANPLEGMDEDLREAVVGLLLETVLMSLARQETFGPVLKRALVSLGLAAVPTMGAYSFSSENNTLENIQTTKGQTT